MAFIIPARPAKQWRIVAMRSISKLLAKHRGVRNNGDLPKLTEASILAWADAYYAPTGFCWENRYER